jgi:hypothetical protein
MPSPPTEPRLHKDVALEVAHVAHVPLGEIDQFCEMVQGTVEIVWQNDRRAVSSKPGQALIEATQAARTLYKAFSKLNQQDRDWVESLFTRNAWYGGKLPELPLTVWRIAHLFSTATGKSLRGGGAQAISRKKPDWRQRTVKDVTFENFLSHLLVDVAESGGELTFTKEGGTGTLIVALDILRPHLPDGVVPEDLSLGTIQKVKTNYGNFYAGYADLGISPPKTARRRRAK